MNLIRWKRDAQCSLHSCVARCDQQCQRGHISHHSISVRCKALRAQWPLATYPIGMHKTPWCLSGLTLSRQNTLQNNCAVEILLEIDANTTLIVLIDCKEVNWRAAAVMEFKSATG